LIKRARSAFHARQSWRAGRPRRPQSTTALGVRIATHPVIGAAEGAAVVNAAVVDIIAVEVVLAAKGLFNIKQVC
jgi:hypothetical protein